MKSIHLLFLGLLTSQSYAATTIDDTYSATRLAGVTGFPGLQDGVKDVSSALDKPSLVHAPSMAVGISPGKFLFTDTKNHTVREWYNGTVTTPKFYPLYGGPQEITGPEIFHYPTGLAKIFNKYYVANTVKNCIEVLTPILDISGSYRFEEFKRSNKSRCTLFLDHPTGLCFDEDDGNLYVVENKGARISKIDITTHKRHVIAGAGAHEVGHDDHDDDHHDDHGDDDHHHDHHHHGLDYLDIDRLCERGGRGSHDGSHYGSHDGSHYGSHDGSHYGCHDGYESDTNTVYSKANDDILHCAGHGHEACFYSPLHITKIKTPATATEKGFTTFYLTDERNNAIRTIKEEANGKYTVATLPLTGESITAPQGITALNGNLYVTTENKVVEINPTTKTAVKIYGNGESWTAGDLDCADGIAAVDTTGNGELNLLVMDKSRIQKLQKVPASNPDDSTNGKGGNMGSRGAASKNASGSATEDPTEGGAIDDQFRFGLSPEQVKLTMRQRINFGTESGSNDNYTKALNALEKNIDATQAVKQIGKGMTFWISGLYTQGQTDAMLGNPAMTDKHGGIIAGTHYKDAATQQIFGVAVDVGVGNSISKSDRDLKTDIRSAQITLYYNKTFNKSWKFNWHNSFMRAMDRHQRPFLDNGNKLIGISNGISHEISSNIEVSYKKEFSKDNYLKPFVSGSYTYNKQFSYQEKNVGIHNRSYNDASTDQIGAEIGLKSSIGYKISETKNFVIMPKISYTNFVKMGKVSQTSFNISSGQASVGKSGTPGRHLFSGTLGIGIADYEANTTTRLAYTGSIQEQRKSHEVMVDWGMKF